MSRRRKTYRSAVAESTSRLIINRRPETRGMTAPRDVLKMASSCETTSSSAKPGRSEPVTATLNRSTASFVCLMYSASCFSLNAVDVCKQTLPKRGTCKWRHCRHSRRRKLCASPICRSQQEHQSITSYADLKPEIGATDRRTDAGWAGFAKQIPFKASPGFQKHIKWSLRILDARALTTGLAKCHAKHNGGAPKHIH